MTVTRRREGAVATRASAEEVFVDVGEVGATEEDAGGGDVERGGRG